MSTLPLPSLRRLPSWRLPDSRDAWRAWATEHSFALRLAAAGSSIGLAYHYSLLTLVRALGLDTPLAYLGLVPLMAAGIAWLRARPAEDDLDIHDRQVDVIVGVPLLLGAVLIVALLPSRLSSLFWVWRVDLLSLPLFVAGVITLVFGLRALWRLRVAVGFLLLAWPLPYTALLNRWLDGLTGLTVDALARVVQWWEVATPSASGDGSLFRLVHNGQPFVLSVASSCSGVNGVVGFLLVGVGVAALVEGSRTAKALWLTVGVALVWALNVVRVLLIFWAGGSYGERVAVDGLHPVIGLVLFCAGIGVMAWAMPLFRLRLPAARPRAPKPAVPAAVATGPVSSSPPPHHRVAVPRAKGALALLLVLTAFMGVANAGMRQYELVAGDLGEARLASFDTQPAVVPGFTVSTAASYPWASRFFGDDSSWTRYSYLARGARLTAPVTADVVSTSDLGRYNAYGIEACYKFHGYGVQGAKAFDLGGGVTGNVLTYSNPRQGVTWDVVYWVWPVKTDEGDRFERVTLLLPSTAGAAAATGSDVAATPRTDPVRRLGTETLGTDRTSTDTTSLDDRRRFLVDFAKVIVTTRPGTV